MRTLGCMCNRQIARDLEVSPETIARRLRRLGRKCLLIHAEHCRNVEHFETIVVDGFESFEWSQYFPFHHLVAVEKRSNFFIYFNDIELRRKGSMTRYQRKKRDRLEKTLGRPNPRATVESMEDLIRTVGAIAPITRIHTDDHPAYRLPIRRMSHGAEHIVTSGKARRNRANPLWEVNLLDLVIRHGSSNHKRETIAWSKRRQCSSERLAILLVWRNYMKGITEKKSGSPTPAMCRGMLQRPVSIEEILLDRKFPTRIALPARWRDYYAGCVQTRAIPHNRAHDLKYAY